MKLWGAVAISISVLSSSEKPVRPDAYYKQDNSIVFSFYDHRDENVVVRNHTLLIQKVTTVNGKTVANATLVLIKNGKPTYRWSQRYACDSLNFYADASNWFYVGIDDKSESATATGDSLVYPLNMKVGDSLPTAHATKVTTTSYSIKRAKMDFGPRKVVAVDTLVLSFGTIAAFRIATTVRSAYVYEDSEGERAEDTYDATEWFSPVYGIVKRKYEFGKGSYTITTMETSGQ